MREFALPPTLNTCIVLPMFAVGKLGREIAELAVHLDARAQASRGLLDTRDAYDASLRLVVNLLA